MNLYIERGFESDNKLEMASFRTLVSIFTTLSRAHFRRGNVSWRDIYVLEKNGK